MQGDYHQGGQMAVLMSGRTVVDTRSPFKSVKEAVALFGERVLAGELYAKHLQEMQREGVEHTNGQSNYRTLNVELEETKQSLEQALEENGVMSNTLETLKLELEQAKAHLAKYQAQEDQNKKKKKTTEVEIEEVKCIENTNMNPQSDEGREDDMNIMTETERMKYVKFAAPHCSLARVMADSCENEKAVAKVKNKKPKKMVHPLVGWLIGKKKSTSQACRSSKEDVKHSAYM